MGIVTMQDSVETMLMAPAYWASLSYSWANCVIVVAAGEAAARKMVSARFRPSTIQLSTWVNFRMTMKMAGQKIIRRNNTRYNLFFFSMAFRSVSASNIPITSMAKGPSIEPMSPATSLNMAGSLIPVIRSTSPTAMEIMLGLKNIFFRLMFFHPANIPSPWLHKNNSCMEATALE